MMDARTLARGIALGRVAFGVALLATPSRSTTVWLGRDDASRPGTAVAVRGLGARDLALGAGTLAASPDALAAWVAASIMGDLSDLAATLRAGSAIPRTGRIGVSALAAGAVGLGAVALAGLRRG